MSVKLKQRTFTDKDGRAVGEGDPTATFLLGSEGRTVSNETALATGLIDGHLPESVSKERRDSFDKELHTGQDKQGMRQPMPGRPLNPVEEPATRKEKIKGYMRAMAEESKDDPDKEKKLFTDSGLPDVQELTRRMGNKVNTKERGKAWKEVLADVGSEETKPETETIE